MRGRDVMRFGAGLVGAMGLALAGAGCAIVGPTYKAPRSASAAHVSGDAIHVETKNGRVVVREDPAVLEVTIAARLKSKSRERLDGAQVVAERQEGEPPILLVTVAWPDGTWRNGDGASFDITLPSADGVSVANSNGAVHVVGLSGGVNIKTSNGPIDIDGHAGPAILDTSNGAIHVKGGAITTVRADTSNGPVTVRGASGTVHADTSNGVIDVALTPENAGPVHLDTSNAPITLAIGPAFAGRVEFDTSNGRTALGPFPDGFGMTDSHNAKGDGYAVFKEGTGEASVLDTSNGNITVKGVGG